MQELSARGGRKGLMSRVFEYAKNWGVQEGRSPSPKNLPLSFEGEGDKGGEVEK